MDKRQACENWVNGFSAMPLALIEKAYKDDMDTLYEITPIAKGDEVYIFSGKHNHNYGCVKSINYEKDTARVDIGDKVVAVKLEDIDVQRDGLLPMWGTMWAFGGIDNYWLEDEENRRKMAECGFRIYESDEIGYFFGIDGAGYSFYEHHWLPLYDVRGLQWHNN